MQESSIRQRLRDVAWNTQLRLQRHSRCQTVLLLRSRNLSQFQQATQWTTQDMDTKRR
ncbi:hypothetical protein F2Q70_00042996 [Brassica cretica]|uniref:Uncharacterized protein n=1 Tax=Brassica cretica TaxID=69181 RepID=A0A8S9KIU1_BRACR|nr:hypothetical protein F2Q70_00042996 [Brassica cretica]